MAKRAKASESSMAALNDMRGDLPPEVIHDGVRFTWMVSERVLKALREYDVREDDIWVTTYPKAGTHWTVEIVNLVLANGVIENIDRTKQPGPMEFDFAQPGAKDPKTFPPLMQVAQHERALSWPSPRVLFTHVPENMMPKKIYEGRGKVIFVLRNPKDLAVSLWNFYRPSKFNAKYEQWDTFFDTYCSDDMVGGSWFSHNLAFWKKHRHDKNFLFLKFEDMKRDLRGAVVQIADFLGRPLSDEVIDRIVEKCTVDSMKQRFTTTGETSGNGKLGAPSIIRKGIVGDWKNQFTVAQSEIFDKLYREKMEGSGLHIDFEI